MSKPIFSVNKRGLSVAVFESKGGRSVCMPQKRYNKNWKDKNLKPEWVESKTLFENEIDVLIEVLQELKEKLAGNMPIEANYDKNQEIPF